MIEQIIRNIKLLYLVQLYSWKNQFAYRLQAFVWLFYFALNTVVTYAFITIIYNVSGGIPGWSYAQMLLLSAAAIMLYGIVNTLVDMSMGQTLMSGGFDSFLAKPISLMLLVLSNFNSALYASGIVSGIILFSYASYLLNLSLLQLIYFIPLYLAGVLVVALFVVVLIVSSYKLFRGGSWINWFFNAMNNFARYPLSIYGILGPLVFTFIIPLGLATYYPVQVLTGKIDGVMATWIFLLEMILVILLTFSIRKLFEKYSSGMG